MTTEPLIFPPVPFVFGTVGTDHHGFDRLVGWLDKWTQDTGFSTFIQTGTSMPPKAASFARYLSFSDQERAVASACVVVSHAGPGTILQARQHGHMPIVVPRNPVLGEHVDSHQLEFAEWIEGKGQVVVARKASDLYECLSKVLANPSAFRIASRTGDPNLAVERFGEMINNLLQTERRHE